MTSRRKRVAGFILLAWTPVFAAAALPTRADVDQVVNKHFALVDKEISAAQKAKIGSYIDGFPSGGASCPGTQYKQGQDHVETLDRAGGFLQAGFEAVFKGQLGAAEWCFLQALKLNGDCPLFLNNAAFTLNMRGFHADALILLNYAIGRDPAFVSAWVNIGYAGAKTKSFEQAKKAYQMAIGLSPEIEDYRKALMDVYAAAGEKKKVDGAKLDAALDVLGKGKNGAAGKGTKTTPPPGPQEGGPAAGAGAAGGNLDGLVSKMGSSYGSDMDILGRFIPILSAAAGDYMKEAEWHGKQADKSTGVMKSVHEVGFKGLSLLSQIFRGYIAEIGGSWEKAGDIVQQGFVNAPDRPKDYNPAKGLAPEMKFPPISIGFDGLVMKIDPNSHELEMEIGEGIIFGFSVSDNGWAVKLGAGIQAHAGVVGAEASYFFLKYDSLQGWGGEGKISAQAAGVKAEMPVYEHSWAFEPGPPAAKKPLFELKNPKK